MMTFLAPPCKMRGSFGSIGEAPGGLDDNVHAVVFPGYFGGVFLCQYFDFFPIDDNTVCDSFHGAFILSVGAVPF